MQDEPTDQTPELLDEQAPDQDLRAARVRIREVGSILRQALAEDEELAEQTEGPAR